MKNMSLSTASIGHGAQQVSYSTILWVLVGSSSQCLVYFVFVVSHINGMLQKPEHKQNS